MQYRPASAVVEGARLDVGACDVRVRRCFSGLQGRQRGGLRGRISRLSDASRRRLIYQARNLTNLRTLLTFTYPHERYSVPGREFMADGRLVKDQFRKLRQALCRRGLAGFWFLEFQVRGAPHFHVFAVGELSTGQLDSLRKLWWKIVGSGCPHHRVRGVDYQVLRKPEAAAGYAAKYSSKESQKTVPECYADIGRFWGFFGDLPKPVELSLSYRDVYQLIRVARKASQVAALERGFRVRRDRGVAGFASWYAGAAIRDYLARVYRVQESPGGYRLAAYRSRSPGC